MVFLHSSNLSQTNITETMELDNDAASSHQLFASPVILTVFAVIAFFMNLFSFINLLCNRKLRTNKYLRAVLCLSVGDMIASVCAVHWFVRRFVAYKDVSDIECLINFVALCSSLHQTHLQMVLLAAERYLASRGTTNIQRFCRFYVQIVFMVFSWVLSVIYNIINSFYHMINGTYICQSGHFLFFVDPYSRVGLVVCLPFLLSIAVLILLYSFTVRNIKRSVSRVGHFHRRPSNSAPTHNRYVMIICAVVVSIHLSIESTAIMTAIMVLWLPRKKANKMNRVAPRKL